MEFWSRERWKGRSRRSRTQPEGRRGLSPRTAAEAARAGSAPIRARGASRGGRCAPNEAATTARGPRTADPAPANRAKLGGAGGYHARPPRPRAAPEAPHSHLHVLRPELVAQVVLGEVRIARLGRGRELLHRARWVAAAREGAPEIYGVRRRGAGEGPGRGRVREELARAASRRRPRSRRRRGRRRAAREQRRRPRIYNGSGGAARGDVALDAIRQDHRNESALGHERPKNHGPVIEILP